MKTSSQWCVLNLCECGCGTQIPALTTRKTLARFVKGHHFRVLKPTRTHGRSQTREYKREMGRKHYHPGRTYGLTKDEYAALLDATNGLCPICARALAHPHIDHDHKTG